MALQLLRRGARRCWQTSITAPGSSNLKRSLFGSAAVKPEGPTCFTFAVPFSDKITKREELLAMLLDIQRGTELSNSQGHDAAAVLVSPGLARLLGVDGVLADLTAFLSGSAPIDQFDLLTAVVDHVAPVSDSRGPEEGISILRGRRDDILPRLWQPSSLEAKQDPDAVGALTFGLGDICTVTVPLARTIFKNNKLSTLAVSSFDVSGDASPRLLKSVETLTHHISLPASALERSQTELELNFWLPLLPLTRPRTVTESYGNIVRGVDVDGKTSPASSELEDAVNGMYSKQKPATDTPTAPVNVFALVMPKSPDTPLENARPAPESWLDVSLEDTELAELVSRNSQFLEEAYLNGGRLYKLLSGGGGWGVKKGLLSLDPQEAHFALSDEKEMERFFQADGKSGYAPPGSEIQFFASLPSPPQRHEMPQGFVFGVFGGDQPAGLTTELQDMPLRMRQFGALSDQAVYVSSRKQEDSKISVPGSQISLSLNLNEGRGSRNFGADVATLGIFGALGALLE